MCVLLRYAKAGTHQQHGYSNSAYGMSKVGLTALTKIQQRNFDKDSRPDLVVNAVIKVFHEIFSGCNLYRVFSVAQAT